MRSSYGSHREEDETREESSSIAEDLVAGLLSRSHNESDGLPLDTSASSRNLPRGKLHWTYAQLERCMETKTEPLAWILQLIMREIWKK